MQCTPKKRASPVPDAADATLTHATDAVDNLHLAHCLDTTFAHCINTMVHANDLATPADPTSTTLRTLFANWSLAERLAFAFLVFRTTEQDAGDLTNPINLAPHLTGLGIDCPATTTGIAHGIQAWYAKTFRTDQDTELHSRAQQFFDTARAAQHLREYTAKHKHAKDLQGVSIATIDGHTNATGRALPDNLVLYVLGTLTNVDPTATARKTAELEKTYLRQTVGLCQRYPEMVDVRRGLVRIDQQPVLVVLRQHDGNDDEDGEFLQPTPDEDDQGYLLRTGSTTDMLLRVTLINLGTSPIEYEPRYVGSDGGIEREEKVQLAVGEQCELPYPLQRSEGEASEAWHLLDANGALVARIVFTNDGVTGPLGYPDGWETALAERLLECKTRGVPEDDDGNLSLAVQALDVLGAAARGRRTKGGVRSAGRRRGVGDAQVMSVRVMTAEELLHGKMQLRYVRCVDRGVDATDAVYFRPDATELVGELHGGGGTYCLQVAVEGDCAATVEAVVAVERKVHRALQAVDEATRALALQAMAQFRQTLAVGAWQNVPVLCGLEVRDVLNAGSLTWASCLAPGKTLDKYRYDIVYTVAEAQRYATHVEQRADGSAVIVEAAAGEMRAAVGQVVLREKSCDEPNVTGVAYCALPSPLVAQGAAVRERKAFVAAECALCLEEVTGSVTLLGCSNGHSLCGACGAEGCRKLFKCPLCREAVDVQQQRVVPLRAV